jgi:hypothetical protein
VLEAILHLGAFGVGERGLDSMFVAGAKFDGFESGGLQGPMTVSRSILLRTL